MKLELENFYLSCIISSFIPTNEMIEDYAFANRVYISNVPRIIIVTRIKTFIVICIEVKINNVGKKAVVGRLEQTLKLENVGRWKVCSCASWVDILPSAIVMRTSNTVSFCTCRWLGITAMKLRAGFLLLQILWTCLHHRSVFYVYCLTHLTIYIYRTERFPDFMHESRPRVTRWTGNLFSLKRTSFRSLC